MTTELDARFKPTTRDVAVFIKNRTVDDDNNFIGDFTPTTTVKDTEVEDLINQAGELILASLHYDPDNPDSLPEENDPSVQTLIALMAACLVELTKFSEQIERNVSPYQYLKALFDQMLGQLQGKLGIASTGKTGMSLIDLYISQSKTAVFEFPDDPMVNWQTFF